MSPRLCLRQVSGAGSSRRSGRPLSASCLLPPHRHGLESRLWKRAGKGKVHGRKQQPRLRPRGSRCQRCRGKTPGPSGPALALAQPELGASASGALAVSALQLPGESNSQQSLPTARGLGSGPVHGPAGPCFRVLASGARLKAQPGQNPPPSSWGHGQNSGSWPRGPRRHIRPSPPRPSSKRGGDPRARRKSSLSETAVARDPSLLPPLPVLLVGSKSRASPTRGRGPHRLSPGGRMVGPARGLPHTGVRRRAGPRRREGGPQSRAE